MNLTEKHKVNVLFYKIVYDFKHMEHCLTSPKIRKMNIEATMKLVKQKMIKIISAGKFRENRNSYL